MAYSYVQYPGNGSTTNWSVTFPFISRDHVTVTKNGVTQAFTWINDAVIQITPAVTAGNLIEIRRKTSQATKLVDFEDAGILTEALLDLQATQSFYMAQEAYDIAEGTIPLSSSGVFDAANKRITNVANPTASQDAVTKSYGDANYGGTAASNAAASASAASASATLAQQWAVQTGSPVSGGQYGAKYYSDLAISTLASKADLASPTFTGDPKAPTPSTADNDTSIATTAYVKSNLTSYAPLASPTLTGTPTAPTAATATNTTQIATTAFVQANTALKANVASPSFTGTAAFAGGASFGDQVFVSNVANIEGLRILQTTTGLDFRVLAGAKSTFYNFSNHDMTFGTNGLDRITVKANGRMLINTATDDGVKNLQVSGGSVLNAGISVFGTNTPEVKVTSTGGATISLQADSTAAYLGTNSNSDIFLYRNGGALLDILATGIKVTGSASTTDPTSGAGPLWKLGAKKAAAVALDTGNYVEISIGGTIVKLAIVT